MHRRRAALAALAGLVVYIGAGCVDAQARTECESRGMATVAAPAQATPAAPAAGTNGSATSQPAPRSEAAHDDTVVAAGGSAPAPGDDEAAGNLGTPVGGTRKRGLRWQSLLPGVIK
jgi:hypothetical protein